MFTSIHLRSLRNNEFIQFIKNVLQILEQKDPAALKIEAYYSELKASVDLMNAAHKKSLSSSLTKVLVEIDDCRDKAINGIIMNLDSYKQHFDEEVVRAANKLMETINLYDGNIARYSYQHETNALEDILSKWKKDEASQAALQRLHLNEWATHLEEQNVLFNNKFIERATEQEQYANIKITEIRKEIIEKYNKVLQYLSAYATIEPSEEYTYVVHAINGIIQEYERVLTLRSAKRETEEEDEELSNTENINSEPDTEIQS